MICKSDIRTAPSTKRDSQRRICYALLGLAMLCVTGCSTDSGLQSLREQFVISAEPESPTTIAVAKSKVESQPRVEFVGRIASNETEAFTPGKATFLVMEILADEDGHGGKDHAANCPFCKKRAAEAPRAAVQFVGKDGETLDVDARKLFGVEPGDKVVIRGVGELEAELDLFMVTADGIYLQESE